MRATPPKPTSTGAANADTSQNGEEKVLRGILDRLPPPVGWCVEFGAWDGKHLSNSYSFITDGWDAVLIEADPGHFQNLLGNWGGEPRVTALNRTVGWGADDSLDAILADTAIPIEFDFLSVDIDGNDYHVWQAVTAYRPRVVVIEFNQTIPNSVDFVQAPDPRVSQGSSIRAIVRLGREKGYELVATTRFNAFLVRGQHFPAMQVPDNSVEWLRPEVGAVTNIFFAYDGTVLLSGTQVLPWHNLRIKDSRVQVLPRFLRTYPLNYKRWQLRLYYLYRARDIITRATSARAGLALLRGKIAAGLREQSPPATKG